MMASDLVRFFGGWRGPLLAALVAVLAGLPALIAREAVKSPALIVIGDVVTRARATDCLPTFFAQHLEPAPLTESLA